MRIKRLIRMGSALSSTIGTRKGPLAHIDLRIAFAIAAVAVMLLTPLTYAQESDADGERSTTSQIPTGDDYMYVIKTDANNVNIQDVLVSVDGSALVSKYRVSASSEDKSRATTINGSWKINKFWDFDPDTGLGPFNAFYAAFNTAEDSSADAAKETKLNTANGTVAYVLNPYKLTETLNGTSYSYQKYNIMIVIPTVYWKAQTEGSNVYLYVSSKASYTAEGRSTISGMMAYAHTFTPVGQKNLSWTENVTVMPYVAIGVYEGQKVTMGGKSTLVSKSGVTPTNLGRANQIMNDAKSYANNNVSASGSAYMVWNYYQWELSKIMGYTVMGTKNSQAMVGYGHSDSGTSNTGGTDARGPYYGNNSGGNAPGKLFIENSWGSAWDLIGSLYNYNDNVWTANALGGLGHFGNKNSGNNHKVNNKGMSGQITKTFTNSESWDIPSGTGSASTTSLSYPGDYACSNGRDCSYMIVGGAGPNNTGCGLNYYRVNSFPDHSGAISARLAYAMSANAVAAQNHDIEYDANGGTGKAPLKQKFQDGDMLIPAKNPFTAPTNKFFDHWNTAADGSGDKYLAGESKAVDGESDVKLYAIWVNVAVHLYSNNGKDQQYLQYVHKDVESPLDDISVMGFDAPLSPNGTPKAFLYWTAGSPGTDEKYGNTGLVKFSIATNLYANWGYPFFTVVYMSNGEPIEREYVETEFPYALRPADPICEGYHFAGWYADAGMQEPFDFTAPIDGDVTIYAKWIQIMYVTFDSYGGSEIPVGDTLFGDPVAQPSDPTRDKYLFRGWYTDYTFNRMYDFSNDVRSDFTLIANWAVDPAYLKYDVHFQTAGGSPIADQEVANSTPAQRPADPTRQYHDFDGWFTDSSLSTMYDFTTQVTEPVTLYAGWTEYTYTIVFNTEGGIWKTTLGGDSNEAEDERMVTVRFSEPLKLPTGKDIRNGDKVLAGWSLNEDGSGQIYKGTITYLTTVRNAEVALYAVWETPEPIEEDDDIFRILDANGQSPRSRDSHNMEWLTIAIGATIVAVASALVLAVFRKRNFFLPSGGGPLPPLCRHGGVANIKRSSTTFFIVITRVVRHSKGERYAKAY